WILFKNSGQATQVLAASSHRPSAVQVCVVPRGFREQQAVDRGRQYFFQERQNRAGETPKISGVCQSSKVVSGFLQFALSGLDGETIGPRHYVSHPGRKR